MAQLEKRDITRVNMNLPTSMVKKVKEYAEELGLPITQAYTVLINSALQQKETMKILPDLLNSFQEAKGMLNDEKSFKNEN